MKKPKERQMDSEQNWPSLSGWESTRDSLHAYAKVAGAPARVLAEPHPKWWHVSLKVEEEGLYSNPMGLDALSGRDLQTSLNLHAHTLNVLLDREIERSFDLTSGDTATDLGRKLDAVLKDLGISVDLPEDKYADNSPRSYDPVTAQRYLSAVRAVNRAMETLRAELDGERSPVQLWPHHFDLAFEWFGTKRVTYEQGGEQVEAPAQINFGFAPGDSSYPDPYFYSNPWPFDQGLTSEPLPGGARWFTDGFEGTLLPYEQLAGAEHADERLRSYYRGVFELARPTLLD
jgi:hypothetical protein